jgi:hypothetical protein
MMGSEPSWADPDNLPTLSSALNWYSYSFDSKDAKEFVYDYAKQVGRSKDELAAIKSAPDAKFNKQFGWIARMLCVGLTPDEKTKEFFAAQYKKLLQQQKKQPVVIEEEKPVTAAVNIQQRISEKAREEAGDIEGLVDDFIASGCKSSIDLDNYLKNKKLSSVVLKKICDIFLPKASHLQDVIDGVEDQYKEGYSNFTKVQLRKYKEFLDAIISATNKGAEANKPVRKTRKKKDKPASVLVAKVSYLAEDPETKLKSVHPEKIIGAKQIWVYNAKTRTLGVYYSSDARGLSVKGSTLQNFNEETSVAKKLRKPEQTIKDLMSAGKIKLRQLLPGLTTKESQLTGRLNSDTIIARVEN